MITASTRGRFDGLHFAKLRSQRTQLSGSPDNGVRRRSLALIGIVALAGSIGLNACGKASTSTGHGPKPLTAVNISMGFVPNIQFAPFYVAVKRGYYRRAGLTVHFNYQTEPDALTLLSNRKVDFVDSGGDEVLSAGARGLRVLYVMTQYSRFPSALFFLKSKHFRSVPDLRGKTIGVPGQYGASYYGLLALLARNRVPKRSVHIETIGYTQVISVDTGKVDAAMGYAPNEPVELRSEGKPVGEFDVYRWANIAGAGLATSDWMIQHRARIVHGFVQATLRGLRYTLRQPGKAFALSKSSIPRFTNPGLQRRVLDRAVAFWRPAGVSLGRMDPRVWKLTARLLLQFKQIPKPVNASSYYTNRFVG